MEEPMSQNITYRPKPLLWGALALLALCSGVRADVIVVDQNNGAGADFVDLPQAIASASHNDLLLVRSGIYSGFTTAKGLRILGLGDSAHIQGDCRIQNLHSSRKFIMTSMGAQKVFITNCAGHVALESHGPTVSGRLRSLVIEGSADVRVRDSNIYSYDGALGPTVQISASDVELVRCDIWGWTGGFNDWQDAGESGRTAVFLDDGSRARISLCNIDGGSGADVDTEWYVAPGDGAPAVHAEGGSEVVITGSGAEVLSGGDCGWGGQFAMEPGEGSPALSAIESSTIRCSGVVLAGGWNSSSTAPDMTTGSGGQIELPGLADLTLEMIGDAIPGQLLTMRVTGPPGGNVRYLLGRIPELNYLPGGFGPDLLVEIRMVNPGVIPASGVRDYDFILPNNLPQGMYFLGQARVIYQGSTYRTPSQVVLVR